MKKFMKTYGAILLAVLFFASCGTKKSEDIDLDDIKTVCDCVDASVIILQDLVEMYEKIEDIEKIDSKTKDRFKLINNKLSELVEHCADIEGGEEGCDNFDEMMRLKGQYRNVVPVKEKVLAANIDVEEIENICECLEAELIVYREINAIYKKVSEKEEVEKEKKEKIKNEVKELKSILEDIEEFCDVIEDEEIEECKSFEKHKEAKKKYKEYREKKHDK